MRKLGIFIGALTLGMAATPALADDRAPTAGERAAIEQILSAEGFVGWDEIEFDDDGYWEVDDARTSDGRQYDLKLAAETYEIVERDLED